MSSSILNDTKKALGLAPDYLAFDPDIVMYINGVLSELNQIGIGPVSGFAIEDAAATWEEFLGDDPRWNGVKTLMYLKVRLLFDPPGTSFAIAAFEKMIEQATWRVSVLRESMGYPSAPLLVIDGGEVGAR